MCRSRRASCSAVGASDSLMAHGHLRDREIDSREARSKSAISLRRGAFAWNECRSLTTSFCSVPGRVGIASIRVTSTSVSPGQVRCRADCRDWSDSENAAPTQEKRHSGREGRRARRSGNRSLGSGDSSRRLTGLTSRSSARKWWRKCRWPGYPLRLTVGGPRSLAGHLSSGGVPHETPSRHPPRLSGRCVASGIRDSVGVHRRPRRGSAGRERWGRHPSYGATKPACDGFIACPVGCDHHSSAGEHDGLYTGVSVPFLSGFRFGQRCRACH